MSSVRGLKARPQTAIVLSAGFALEVLVDPCATSTSFCASLTAIDRRPASAAGRPRDCGHVDQGADVLGEAAAAVADAGEEEAEADAAVVADAAADVVDVGAERSQRLAISLMKLIFVASRALATYLVISALSGDMTRNGLSVRRNGAYSSRSTLADLRPAHADDHAVGLHEVVDRRAFLEELGIAGHVERARSVSLGQPPASARRWCRPARCS